MVPEITKDNLVAFENKVETLYKAGRIKGPIHLSEGNEDQLIEIFKNIKRSDYVFSTWRNHYHALLHGVPERSVLKRILDCDSMAMNHPAFRFYTSAIVGGIAPIATGVAHSLKGTEDRVWCFLGDMAVRTGIAHESITYSIGNKLPISFVIEDNGKSVGTDTVAVWNIPLQELLNKYQRMIRGSGNVEIMHYKFQSRFSHSGVGEFVSF